MSGIKDSNGL